MFGAVSPPWGGHPSATLADVQSGIGWVHNTFMLEGIEKSVLRGPIDVSPKPAWFYDNTMMHVLGRPRSSDFEAAPSAAQSARDSRSPRCAGSVAADARYASPAGRTGAALSGRREHRASFDRAPREAGSRATRRPARAGLTAASACPPMSGSAPAAPAARRSR